MNEYKKSFRLRDYDYSQQGMYFVTICCRDRIPVFADDSIAKAGWEYLEQFFSSNNGYIAGVVILHDHIHIIIEIREKSERNLGKIIMDLKLGLWRTMRRAGLKDKKIWQKNYYEHVIRNNDDLVEKLNYMRNNPIKAGYVERFEEWSYYWDKFLEGHNPPEGELASTR